MNIRLAATYAGVSVKTARYYCDIGLVPCARSMSNYRIFSQENADILRFVARARDAGFTIEECHQLLSLWKDGSRASADVKQLALTRLEKLQEKISELQNLYQSLETIAATCPGDKSSDCPILNALESHLSMANNDKKKSK